MIEIFQNIDNCPEWHCQYCGAYANFITGRLSEHGDPKRIAAVQKDGDDSAIAEAIGADLPTDSKRHGEINNEQQHSSL